MVDPNADSSETPKRNLVRWIIAGGAVLTFVATALGNYQKIIDFWKTNVAGSNPKVELRAFPEGARTEPVPEDEPLPSSLMSTEDESNGQQENGIGNLSSLGQVPIRYASMRIPMRGIGPPFESDAYRVQLLSSQATVNRRSPIVVEAVQSARTDQFYDLWFDVFFRNDSDEDVLLVEAAYRSTLDIPRGDASDSGALLPNALYQIRYRAGHTGRVALAPPYRIAPRSRGAVRFRFHPDRPIGEIDGMNHRFAAWVIDSRGRSRKMIDFP